MANQTTIGELSINLKMRLEGLEKGLETAKRKLQDIEKQNEQLKSSNSSIDASFIAMSTVAVMVLGQIKSAVDEGVQKYNSYVNSMQALQKTAKATNNSMIDIKDAIEDVNELKLMDDPDVTAATKNLLTYGFTVDQTKDILLVLQDAAVGNRQANYSLSEAVRVTTEGIRMENSVLSDAAGVQKNISKMYEEHAKSLGKTTDSLTQAEKAQAVYNGIMAEASMFTGSAAEMASGYQGQQAQLNAVNLELSRTIGESMIPSLTQYSSLQLTITRGLTDFIKSHKDTTAGVVTFATTMLSLIVVLTSAKKAYTAYKAVATAANMTTKAFTASLLANPITLIAVAIAAVVGAIAKYSTAQEENNAIQEKSSAIQERYNSLLQKTFTYTQENIQALQQDKQNVEEQIKAYENLINTKERLLGQSKELNPITTGTSQIMGMAKQYKNAENQLENLIKTNGNYGNSLEELENKRDEYTKAEKEAEVAQSIRKAMDIESMKTQQKEAAQLKVNAEQMQKYLDIVISGNKSTSEYQNAVKELAKAYPEAANAEGIIIDKAQDYINTSKAKADQEWNASQQAIKANIEIMNSFMEMARQAEGSKERQIELANQIGIAYQNIIPTLTSMVNLLSAMSNIAPGSVAGITPVASTYKGSGSSSYQNKALDNYKKQIEHKKAMDQISLKQEISMYQTALKRYARIADEKNEIREKIYELNKELANKEKEILDQQTEDYETYMQKQKNLKGSAYDVKEQAKDYDKIIDMHNKYLKQIMKDERLSLDERKALYREELAVVRDYEQQKRDLRVEAVDSTVSQLTNAITKQLEEMQSKDKEFIDNQIKEVERLKEIRINAINAEYDAKIEAIEKELAALDKAEQQKTRDEEDAEHEKKRKRLEDLIAFEHDVVTKANYQKELDKLLEEYQKTLDARALEDKKEALNEQKDLLQEEQDNKIQAIEDETEKQKEAYNKQLEDLEKYYNKQNEMAQETAEKMLLNVKQNQDNIINLLKKYGDKYEITGQTLGEKLAQGINNGLADKIQSIIQKIQNTIDANLEAKIKEWTASNYKYETSANKPQVVNTNVIQNNYIQQSPEMPSETYRKLNNVSQKLAEEFAGM